MIHARIPVTSLLTTLLLVCVSHIALSQIHIQSFAVNPAGSETTSTDKTVINSLIDAAPDPQTKAMLIALKQRVLILEQADKIRDEANREMRSDVKQQLLAIADRLTGDTLQGLKVSGDIAAKPGAQAGENILTPVLTGDYSKPVSLGCSAAAEMNVHIDLQTAAAGASIEKIAGNLLAGGGEGRLQVTARLGFGEDLRAGVRAGLMGSLAWVGKKSAGGTTTEALGFATCGFVLAAWVHPLILIYQNEYGWVRGAAVDPLALLLNNSMVGNLLIGVQLSDGTYLQLKYPLAGNRDSQHVSNVEVRFVRTMLSL